MWGTPDREIPDDRYGNWGGFGGYGGEARRLQVQRDLELEQTATAENLTRGRHSIHIHASHNREIEDDQMIDIHNDVDDEAFYFLQRADIIRHSSVGTYEPRIHRGRLIDHHRTPPQGIRLFWLGSTFDQDINTASSSSNGPPGITISGGWAFIEADQGGHWGPKYTQCTHQLHREARNQSPEDTSMQAALECLLWAE